MSIQPHRKDGQSSSLLGQWPADETDTVSDALSFSLHQ